MFKNRDELEKVYKKLSVEKRVLNLFEDYARDASFILKRSNVKLKENESLKLKYPLVYMQLVKLSEYFKTSFEQIVRSALEQVWEASERKNDAAIMKVLKGAGLLYAGEKLLKWFNRSAPDPSLVTLETVLNYSRNAEGFAAFLKNDLKISERVWNLAGQNTQLIEQYIGSGLMEGSPAAQITKDLKQFLVNPDARFRRVRDPETGKLKLSRPAKNYHPGQGVYRSAYKNALRLASSEINAAYRLSDQHRWRQIDFVTGYDVKLSAGHVIYDICDEMQGEYPKTFKFSQWHPWCHCYCVPILPTTDQFVEYLNTDKLPKDVKRVTGIPPKAFNHVRDNSKVFDRLKSKPFFLADNFVKKNGVFYPKKGI